MKNIHRIPRRYWARWNKREQLAFNRLWHRLTPELFAPETKMSQRAMKVLRWNICWIVADMMREWRGEWEARR